MLDFGFYNMDCMDGMKEFPDNYFDLAIVDPPYGINIGNSSSKKSVKNITIGGGITEAKVYKAFDDSAIPDKAYFQELQRVCKKRIVWGCNYFIKHLDNTECLIVWDKAKRGLKFADCEVAWSDIKEPCRIFEYQWNGMLQEDMKNKEERIHPTQKPVRLYTWLLSKFAKAGDKILDTHVGSASSLIACEQLGFEYVGFEIDKTYYDLALKRLEDERRQIKWQI